MIKLFIHKISVWLLFGLVIGLAGCAGHSPKTSFYKLVPLAELGELDEAVPHYDFSVGVGPITIPDYLKRPQIVTRESNSRLQIAEFHRWAGLLEKDIAAVMVDNLTDLLGSERVVTYPWDRLARPDYRVVYDIQRFDGTPGVEAVLKVRWTVFDTVAGKAEKVLGKRYRLPLNDPGYESLVKAESELLGQFSRDVAAELLKKKLSD